MNQPLDYKKLAYQIGAVISSIVAIIGMIFIFVALIEIGRCETNLKNYLDSYDYSLLTMRTYGIAMMVGGWIALIVNAFFANPKNIKMQSANAVQNATVKPTRCEICGAKTAQLTTITIADNEKIHVCANCRQNKSSD
ncbi:MAG: hypothetical protein J6K63_03380 [Clostridia bacterium]|nr:hypothetical protein [Clostridia bacterium]